MKKNIFYTIIAILLVAVIGCKDYLDVNINPNAPTVTVPDLVLSGALTESARILSADMNAYAAYWAGYWSASGTYSNSGDIRRFFNLNNTNFQNVWSNCYLNAANYNYVENASKSIANYDNFRAISKIMKVYDFHTLIDNYGNIPYTSALKGFKSLSPTYDDASVVYEALSAQLDSAVAIIQNAPTGTVVLAKTVDIMFQGDMNNWAKLANTMNLRLLLRQSEIGSKSAFITAELAKINANGAGFLDSDAIINPGYAKATNLQNPFWETNGLGVGDDIGNRDYNRASEYSVRYFVLGTDPRADLLFRRPGSAPGTNTGTAGYKGIPFGAPPDADWATSKTSAFGLGVMPGPAGNVVFFSNAQSQFLQAEAAFRGWIIGDPRALYEAGITASFTMLGESEASATAYYNSGNDYQDWDNSPDKLKAIITQKWAANTSIDAMEAWSDVRRLNIPGDLPQSLEPLKINPTPPIRLLYPQTEYSNNASAVAAQGSIDQFTSKIFWQP